MTSGPRENEIALRKREMMPIDNHCVHPDHGIVMHKRVAHALGINPNIFPGRLSPLNANVPRREIECARLFASPGIVREHINEMLSAAGEIRRGASPAHYTQQMLRYIVACELDFYGVARAFLNSVAALEAIAAAATTELKPLE